MSKLVFIIFIIFSLQSNAEEWRVIMPKCEGCNPFIELVNGRGISVEEAIDQISTDEKNFSIRIMCCVSRINKELTDYYLKEIPVEFGKALNSSGNLHNPTMIPLTNSFKTAFESTSFYKNLNLQLKLKNIMVSQMSFEKLILLSSESPYKYHADVWLDVICL